MPNRTKHLAVTAALAALVIAGATGIYRNAFADSASVVPGSTDDPIVTKSYVDQRVADLVKDEVAKQLAAGGGAGGAAKLEVVTVPAGNKIIVEDGGELIIRTGKAIAYSGDTNGLSDMTAGLDIAPGKPVATNHLILFPRGGRGVQPDPAQKNGLTVLVRGKYTIVQ